MKKETKEYVSPWTKVITLDNSSSIICQSIKGDVQSPEDGGELGGDNE